MTLMTVIAVVLLGCIGAAWASHGLYLQDFSTDASGWLDSDDDWYGTVTHNAESGTATMEGDDDSAPFSRFDGYRATWPGDYFAELDVYLDPSWALGTGFDYSVASSGSDGNHQRDYIFHVTRDTSTGGLLVAGSNNSNFAPRQDLENINHYVVTTAGWYTFQHHFRDNGGVLAVDLNLLDDHGAVLFTETRSNPGDTIPGEVGGNRYAWFTFVDVDGGVEVDNHELRLDVADPLTKGDCTNGGWQDFGFSNQGRCIAFVNTGHDSR